MYEITITVATQLQAELIQGLLESDYAQDFTADTAYELEVTEVGGNETKADTAANETGE